MSDQHAELEPRRDYTQRTLSRAELATNPVIQFGHWLDAARSAGLIDATAMSLATVDAEGQPHCRIVLLKSFDDTGFCFYTNQTSDKGREIASNARVALLFYWRELERQVRIEGLATRLDPAEADSYFHSRPEGSRFSAAASMQSAPVASRAVLEQRVAELHQRYPDAQVPRPEHWGGYRVAPRRLEFWQGRADRLHDRFIYVADDQRGYTITRLSP